MLHGIVLIGGMEKEGMEKMETEWKMEMDAEKRKGSLLEHVKVRKFLRVSLGSYSFNKECSPKWRDIVKMRAASCVPV